MSRFLPISKQDMQERGISQLDFVYVIGDAYVDHSSFGPAIIGRTLELFGYSVGIISQPDWKDMNSITVLGAPRLAFLVSSGNMDSMVNHYSVSKIRRKKDNYTAGGEMGKRPDYACVVYSNLIRKTYKQIPIVLGGIEASLRRFAHYDYWSNKVKRSVLLDSGADMILYGMGERSIIELADALDSGLNISDITYLDGTVYRTKDPSVAYNSVMLPSFEEITASKTTYAKSFYLQHLNSDAYSGKSLIEPYPNKQYIVVNPPQKPLSTEELDRTYELPFENKWHPIYDSKGGIPAFAEIKFSLTSNRGCFGGCNFCAITFHEGRIVQARSQNSLVRETYAMTRMPDFKGYIHDVGGPTANFREPACKKQKQHGACMNKQCMSPILCSQLKVDHSDYITLLRRLRNIPHVKKVFVRSGIRYDYVLADQNQTFLEELCKYHVSGQLRIAPEHISEKVLSMMGKPKKELYERFVTKFYDINKRIHKNQYVVPYLMSSHPGSTLKEAIELAEFVRDSNLNPEQVQDFYPTPSTIATTMYYTGVDPRTMQPVYTPTNPHEKALQRALLQYKDPKNYSLVKEALYKANRTDLIGYGKNCLIPPRPWKKKTKHNRKKA